MPSVCIVIAQLYGGGAERVTAALAEDLVAAGWDISVITLGPATADDHPLPKAAKRITLSQVGVSSNKAVGALANLRRLLSLRGAIRRAQPDVALAMMTTTAVITILATLAFPCRVVVSERVYPPHAVASNTWKFLRAKVYRFADLVVVQTEAGAAWLREHCNTSRVAVIPNAVLPPEMSMSATSIGIEASASQPVRVILGVGRLDRQKGFDLLIAAFAKLAADYSEWALYILGDGPERACLQQLIIDHGLACRAHLVGRVRDIESWYQRCDIFCLSSRYEGFPNALLEAMSAARAVVSFDCLTGPAEVIIDRENGLLVDLAGGADSLAAALAELMRDQDMRQRLASRAGEVRERFSRSEIALRWRRALAGGAEVA